MTEGLYTIAQFVRRHDFLTEAGLRYHVQKRNENGFSAVIVRMGRRILINEQKFFEWMEKNGAE